jgi:FMN phosphatase YigB (HAD superfamily)
VILNMDAAGAMAERAAGQAAAETLGHPERGPSVGAHVSAHYDTLRRDLRRSSGPPDEAYRALYADICRWQAAVVRDGHEVKRWSRESLVAIALEDEGLRPTGDAITSGSDAYWSTLAARSEIMTDVAPLLSVLRRRGVHVHLATNSDGFLKWQAGQLTYDPDDAIARKHRRLTLLGSLGFGPANISVGDPIGKPDRRFYERVLTQMSVQAGHEINPGEILVVGDSLSNDVVPPMMLGAAQGAWIVRDRREPGPVPLTSHHQVVVIRSLDELESLLP